MTPLWHRAPMWLTGGRILSYPASRGYRLERNVSSAGNSKRWHHGVIQVDSLGIDRQSQNRDSLLLPAKPVPVRSMLGLLQSTSLSLELNASLNCSMALSTSVTVCVRLRANLGAKALPTTDNPLVFVLLSSPANGQCPVGYVSGYDCGGCHHGVGAYNHGRHQHAVASS